MWWIQGDMDRAAAAYEAARNEAEQHAVAGERAHGQAHRAFVLAFTAPALALALANDELDLAQQLPAGLDLRATTPTTQIAALVRDAGTASDVEDRAHTLRAETSAGGLLAAQVTLELAACFHHAVVGADDLVTATISRLRHLPHSGDYAHYVDIAHFMANLPLDTPSPARWPGGEQAARQRWRELVTAESDPVADQPAGACHRSAGIVLSTAAERVWA